MLLLRSHDSHHTITSPFLHTLNIPIRRRRIDKLLLYPINARRHSDPLYLPLPLNFPPLSNTTNTSRPIRHIPQKLLKLDLNILLKRPKRLRDIPPIRLRSNLHPNHARLVDSDERCEHAGAVVGF